jgi:hypothetical protein
VADASDCDDAEASTHPGADEYCDGHDDDCDGSVDESDAVDLAIWYLDYDGDGYGTMTLLREQCNQPTGFVDNADDCDDTSSSTNPGADEYCDGHDDDCDGNVDEDSAVDTTVFFADVDGDGFGSAALTASACSAPAGYVADDSDCDDSDATISPAADEYCDGHDDDCDGLTDEDDAVDGDIWFADADFDGFGDATSSTSACSVPSGFVADDSDCDDTDSTTYPGAVEVCLDGVDNNCDGDESCESGLAASDIKLTGTDAGDQAGRWVAGGGDVDGDGYDDVLIGVPGVDAGTRYDLGAVYLVRGPVSVSTDLGSSAVEYMGEREIDYAGCSPVIAGDLDGDGYEDIAVGAYNSDAGASRAGAAYIVFGSPRLTSMNLSSADVRYTGETAYDSAGFSLSGAGDVNADGFDDLLVAAYQGDATSGMNAEGEVYLFLGGTTLTSSSLALSDARFTGINAGDWAGYSLSDAGDVNADGFDDVLIGAHRHGDSSSSYAGAAFLVLGPMSGTSSLSTAEAELVGEAAFD